MFSKKPTEHAYNKGIKEILDSLQDQKRTLDSLSSTLKSNSSKLETLTTKKKNCSLDQEKLSCSLIGESGNSIACGMICNKEIFKEFSTIYNSLKENTLYVLGCAHSVIFDNHYSDKSEPIKLSPFKTFHVFRSNGEKFEIEKVLVPKNCINEKGKLRKEFDISLFELKTTDSTVYTTLKETISKFSISKENLSFHVPVFGFSLIVDKKFTNSNSHANSNQIAQSGNIIRIDDKGNQFFVKFFSNYGDSGTIFTSQDYKINGILKSGEGDTYANPQLGIKEKRAIEKEEEFQNHWNRIGKEIIKGKIDLLPHF